jgi:hypothetical protein
MPPWKALQTHPIREESPLPESDRFESTFSGLSRVNDSLKQIILVHEESGHRKARKKPGGVESETGTATE